MTVKILDLGGLLSGKKFWLATSISSVSLVSGVRFNNEGDG